MIFLFSLFIFIIGTAVGSFLGVVVDRLASKEQIWKGRSHCDHCRHNLAPIDLIPLVSFFLLKQKCRYCHKKLSLFYPIIELITGVVFLLVGLAIMQHTGYFITQTAYIVISLYYCVLVSCLIVIFFTDFRYGIIPFKVVLFAFLLTLLWQVYLPFAHFSFSTVQLLGLHTNILSIVLSALGAGGFFLIIFLATKGRGMGFGDVVYAFLMGFILGYPLVIIALYMAFVIGALASLLLILFGKKKFKGGTIPFGPFLVFGTIVSLLYGIQLLDLVMRFIAF